MNHKTVERLNEVTLKLQRASESCFSRILVQNAVSWAPHLVSWSHKDWGHGPQICILSNFPRQCWQPVQGNRCEGEHLSRESSVEEAPNLQGQAEWKTPVLGKSGHLREKAAWKGLRLLSGRQLGRTRSSLLLSPPPLRDLTQPELMRLK